MKGVIWKYYPLVRDPELRDEMGRVGCVVANPDPDFWENPFPIWSICGPYVRSTLQEGDVVFYTPVISRSRAAGLPDYICTGYLTVEGTLPTKTDLEEHPEITQKYKRNYRSDLAAHERGDRPRTRRLRSQNIAIGGKRHSAWYGRDGLPLGRTLGRAGLRDLDLRSRRIRDLRADEARSLRATLAS